MLGFGVIISTPYSENIGAPLIPPRKKNIDTIMLLGFGMANVKIHRIP